jgi:IclR family transcriptional regulator, KDG regulon repressor
MDVSVVVTEPSRDDRAAIDKAFSLLIAFGDEACTGLGVSELARRSRLSKSTAFRVLRLLERNAMVERVGTNYRLGARLHELGRAVYAPGQDRVRDVLMPCHRTVAAPSRIGGRLPANCTGVGKVLLAYDSDAFTAAIAAPLRGLTAHSITDPAALAEEMASVRRDGVALEREESRIGVNCVAAPVMGRTGRPLASMSVSAPRGTDMRPLTTALRRVCASAAQALTRPGSARSA